MTNDGDVGRPPVLDLKPVTFAEMKAFVALHHRHHRPPQGWKFGVGLTRGDELVGVVAVGRPVARGWNDGYTAELTRCCVREGVPHGASKLYAAAWRAARAMGYRRLITYTLKEEPGTSLVAAGWKVLYETRGKSWNTPKRPRVDKHPTGPKTCWEAA